MIERSKLNALVIDIKGDRGLIPYPSALPLATKIGAQKLRTIPDLKALVSGLKAKNLYLIARIVTFKDTLLATAHPEWAVHEARAAPCGRTARDWRGSIPSRRRPGTTRSAWPKRPPRRASTKIQFDYIRFPDAGGMGYSEASTETSRVAAITGFLREAASGGWRPTTCSWRWIFGYVCWNENDTGIGQRIEDLAAAVDIISPMLYPSGFQFGIPGYRNPVAEPLRNRLPLARRVQAADGQLPARYRPWLQAFTDYAFGGKAFGAEEIGKQTKASRDAGTDGWMLWNPRNVYTTNEIKPEPPESQGQGPARRSVRFWLLSSV